MRKTFIALALLACSCAGPSTADRKELARLERRDDFAAAVERIRAAKDEYGPSNEALYELDLAQALADAGRRPEADAAFAAAQDRMERLWTISVSKRAGAALANENVDDFRGEDFERALAFVLRGVNLLALGRRNEALIEAKRAEMFLDQLREDAPRARSYRDDAFAHWLAARLYEDLGQDDDARISDEAAQRAYRSYAAAYGTKPPPAPAGAGPSELVLLDLDGTVPRKVRKAGDGALGFVLNTSYPAYEKEASGDPVCEVSVGTVSVEARTAEDAAAIAARALDERLGDLKARSVLRATLKLAGTVTGVNSVDSEFADVRAWATLPARIRVARLRVPAGEGRARLRCLDASGRAREDRELSFTAAPGGRAWLIVRTTR
ncbi:MAG: hypothetical protein KGL74_13700 [Elusimicrobia bacterium]|nr:hypothetical protein [Elusimicrobiota bacterium]